MRGDWVGFSGCIKWALRDWQRSSDPPHVINKVLGSLITETDLLVFTIQWTRGIKLRSCVFFTPGVCLYQDILVLDHIVFFSLHLLLPFHVITVHTLFYQRSLLFYFKWTVSGFNVYWLDQGCNYWSFSFLFMNIKKWWKVSHPETQSPVYYLHVCQSKIQRFYFYECERESSHYRSWNPKQIFARLNIAFLHLETNIPQHSN